MTLHSTKGPDVLSFAMCDAPVSPFSVIALGYRDQKIFPFQRQCLVATPPFGARVGAFQLERTIQ